MARVEDGIAFGKETGMQEEHVLKNGKSSMGPNLWSTGILREHNMEKLTKWSQILEGSWEWMELASLVLSQQGPRLWEPSVGAQLVFSRLTYLFGVVFQLLL